MPQMLQGLRALPLGLGILLMLCPSLAAPARAQNPAIASAPAQPADGSSTAVVLLDKLAPYVTQAEQAGATTQQSCGLTGDGYFECFNPQAVLEPSSGKGFVALQTRKLALRAVELYLALVQDIASGRDFGTVTKRSSELHAVLGATASLAALGGPVAALIGEQAVGAISQFSQAIDKSRSEDALRKTLIAGQPVIAQLIDVLSADTALMYEIYKSGRSIEIITIQNEMIAAQHTGTPSQRGQREIDIIVADINSYHRSLYSYVMYLGQTRKALSELSTSPGSGTATEADEMTRLQASANRQLAAQWLWKALADAVIPQGR